MDFHDVQHGWCSPVPAVFKNYLLLFPLRRAMTSTPRATPTMLRRDAFL
ncbi:hypothetical protein BIFGAL_03054 [Bifidobacterium gallicum DSM 20093 = LMG 11596]|uniref:Uncharacterized protein n=1 Tax=Bifidobacterium gallicum DSM 20093 = LMG 11596 TaxID=561180 RepID=D1NT96_9BIFI|nr:hypothetical protein BIFGAL_03054 [Bifidobacterium gallicum DSM 20093 = LMG 11596]